MNTVAINLWRDRKELVTLSNEVREKRDKAEEAYYALLDKYDAMSDEEYAAIADEAEREIEKSGDVYHHLEDHLGSIKEAIRLMEALESEMEFLEEEGVV